MKLSVSEDVAVCRFSNEPDSLVITHALTTVEQNGRNGEGRDEIVG